RILPPGMEEAHRSILDAIAAAASGIDAFAGAPEAARVAIVQAVERSHPEAFRALLVAALSDYYESAPVLAALGWRFDPPQPLGHALPSLNPRLDKVRARGRLWRA